jgi:hypothetical protein
MNLRGTRELARMLGLPPDRLNRLIWQGKLDEPQRGPGGCFCWSEADIRHAAWVLLGRDLDAILAERAMVEEANR